MPDSDEMKRIERSMRRRRSRRPAKVVDNIRADNGSETMALLERMKAAGFGYFEQPLKQGNRKPPEVKMEKRTLIIAEYYALMADELARRQDISGEEFMSEILKEGLYEAFLEMQAQKNLAARK